VWSEYRCDLNLSLGRTRNPSDPIYHNNYDSEDSEGRFDCHFEEDEDNEFQSDTDDEVEASNAADDGLKLIEDRL